LLHSLAIKTNNEYILNYLLKKWEINNLIVTTKNFKIYRNLIVHYAGDNPDSFFTLIAEDITDIIVEFYEKHLVKNIINTNYFYFSDSEKIKIYKEIVAQLKRNVISNKAIIFLQVFNYVSQNKTLILDGFVYFRLKDYISLLDGLVDAVVDHFLVQREYDEFVNLLQVYVRSKESKSDTIHLFYKNEECFLFDKSYVPIFIDMNSLNAKYLSDISFSKNDYVLNTLLTQIPNKLYIHSNEVKDEFINTLELIFSDRIHFCSSCSLCKKCEKENSIIKNSSVDVDASVDTQ